MRVYAVNEEGVIRLPKIEWRKVDKEIYLPKKTPVMTEIPAYKYVVVSGIGNPNDNPEFINCIEALYGFSYGVRMSYKWDNPPKGYYEYTVYPLEGIWDMNDLEVHEREGFSKSNLKYTMMIRQPDFVDETLFEQIKAMVVKNKTENTKISELEFKTIEDGKCVQMMHIGSYDEETKSFDLMNQFISENNLLKSKMAHKEIYLTKPNEDTSKMKTTLRYFIK